MDVKGKIVKVDATSVPGFFVGNGDVCVASPLTLATATVDNLTGVLSLGDLKEGSVKWTGEAPKFTEFKNEQGENVVSVPMNGTYGIEFEVMSFSSEMQAKLLKAQTISATFVAGDIIGAGAVSMSAFGVDMPVIECPLLVLNTDLNKMILFPNAKIISQMVESGGITTIKCTAVAQKVDTANLQTVMVINGNANYTADPDPA